MAENICDIFLILLSVLGLVYIWKLFFVFLLRNKNDKGVYIVIPLCDTIENIEQIVRSTAERTLLMGKSRWDKVVCVDYGISKENVDIVKNLCDEYKFLDYITSENFSEIFLSCDNLDIVKV